MLETKITELTKAVQDLTAVIQALRTTAPVPAPAPLETTPGFEPDPDPAEPAPVKMTHERLQDWALAQVRADKAFKSKLMAALATHNAKTITQLPADALPAVYAELGGEV